MIIINDGVKLEIDDPLLIKRILGVALNQFAGGKEEYLQNADKPPLVKRKWTKSDDEILLDQVSKNKMPRQIAPILNRTAQAVSSRMWYLNKEGQLKLNKYKI